MNTAELIAKKYGVKTRGEANPIVTQVQNAVTKILDNNPNRLSYVIVNLSANDIYISFDREPSATNGIYLAPAGGSFSIDWEHDFELTCWEVNAIAGAINSAIFIQTVLIDQVA